MRARPGPLLVLALATTLGAGGCGGGGSERSAGGRAAERSNPPATPPPGWRTVRNRRAGFSVSAPRRWRARAAAAVTLLRSERRLVAVVIAADRSEAGRSLAPGRYAREALERLPGFRGRVSRRARRVPGPPYRTARVDATGRVRTSRRLQRITVVAYQRPRRVTYAAIAFRSPRPAAARDASVLDRLLASLRAQRPGTPPRHTGR